MQNLLLAMVSKDMGLLWGVVVAVGLVLGQWLLMAFFFWQLPPEIPLWYSLPLGSQQLAIRNWFWLLPVIGLVCLFSNMVLLRLSLGTVSVFRQIIVWLGALVELLLVIALTHIIMLML